MASPNKRPEPKLPDCSQAFAEAIKALPLPEIYPFSTASAEQALKQWGFAQGVLHMKRMIRESYDEHRRGNTTMDMKFDR